MMLLIPQIHVLASLKQPLYKQPFKVSKNKKNRMQEMIRVAFITGVSGQDGAYIARLLLEKGYEVYGSSRDSQMSTFKNLSTLGIKNDINLPLL